MPKTLLRALALVSAFSLGGCFVFWSATKQPKDELKEKSGVNSVTKNNTALPVSNQSERATFNAAEFKVILTALEDAKKKGQPLPKVVDKPLMASSKSGPIFEVIPTYHYDASQGMYVVREDLPADTKSQITPDKRDIHPTGHKEAGDGFVPLVPQIQALTNPMRGDEIWTLINANDIIDLLFNKERETRRQRKHLLSGSKTMVITHSLWSDIYPLSFTIPSEEVIITPQQTLNLPLRSLKMLTKERELCIQRNMLGGFKTMAIPLSLWSGTWSDIYPFAFPTEEFQFDPDKSFKLPGPTVKSLSFEKEQQKDPINNPVPQTAAPSKP